MKFTYSWLKQFIDTGASADEVAYALNSIGFEVNEVIDKGRIYNPFVIAEIVASERHPDAEKLSVCTVFNGKEKLQVVCGAANARAGIKVVLAPVGTIIPANGMQIKAAKIRGIESTGMLCSAEELMLEGESDGIIELANDAAVGQSYADYANLNDVVFDIDITPNRGDATSIYGLARDLAAKGIGTLKDFPASEVKYSGKSPINVVIEDQQNCARFCATYIANINNKVSSPAYTSYLRAIGSSAKSALVDISNYAMLAYGRPNHIYDADKIKGQMVVRKSLAKEKFIAIGGDEYELPEGLTVIADDEKILCVAGVIGGELSKVTEESSNILVEVAEFNAIAVTLAGRALNINTDSRFRFERGIDRDLTDNFANYLNSLIMQTVGGKASETLSVNGSKEETVTEVDFDFALVRSLGGVDLPQGVAKEILARLGFTISGAKVKIPSWRLGTIDGAPDIVEEIIRIYGYDFIPSQSLPLEQSKVVISQTTVDQRLRSCLIMRGMSELITWSFMDENLAKKFGHDNHIRLTNPISSELNVMRQTVVANLLASVTKNVARGANDLSFFEIGAVYNNTFPSKQASCLTGVRVGVLNPRSVHKDERSVNFYDAKADLFAAVEAYGFDASKLTMNRNAPSYYHPGRSACFSLGKNVIAYCGQLHPAIAKEYDIVSDAVAFELFYESLPQVKQNAKRAKLEVSDYQAVVRDFAFIVADSVAAGDFLKALANADPLLESIQVFDVYSGKGVEEGMKSLAITAKIQPKDKTLSEDEINVIGEKILAVAADKFSAKLR